MRGGAWIGLFRANQPATLPHPLQPIVPRATVIALLRYLSGTLHYDELIIGVAARKNWRIGLHVQHIWVNNLESLHGGRNIWGLPKQPATFTWDGSHVSITDDDGLIARLHIDPRTALLPRVPVVAPFFGRRGGQLLHSVARGNARPGRATLRLHEIGDRFANGYPARPLLSLALKPFIMVFPPAQVVQ